MRLLTLSRPGARRLRLGVPQRGSRRSLCAKMPLAPGQPETREYRAQGMVGRRPGKD